MVAMVAFVYFTVPVGLSVCRTQMSLGLIFSDRSGKPPIVVRVMIEYCGDQYTAIFPSRGIKGAYNHPLDLNLQISGCAPRAHLEVFVTKFSWPNFRTICGPVSATSGQREPLGFQ